MKKSLMAAVCTASLLTAMTVLANEYPVTHPFYMPDKGGCYFDVGYGNTQSKFKSEGAKFVYGNNKLKTNTYSVDGTYAVTDRFYFNAGYSSIKNKLNAGSSDLALLFDYVHIGHDVLDIDAKDKNWYIGMTEKFIDNDSMFLKGTIAYYQENGDSYDKTDRGVAVELFCGGRTNSEDPWAVDPYVKVGYTDGNESNGIGSAAVGVYKQFNDKFGINIGVNYTQCTDESKEKYMEGLVDLRYAFTSNCALKVGYGFQIFDKQRKYDYFGAEGLLGLTEDDVKFSLKTKSRNRFFANLMFAF